MDAFIAYLPTLESALALSLLQAAWWGTLLGLAGAAVLAAMPRHSAAARHAVGLGFLVAMLVVPVWHGVALLASDAMPAAGATGVGTADVFATGPSAVVAGGTALPCGWLAGAWAAGVLAMLLRLAGGVWLLRALARVPSAPLPPVWEDRALALQRALGIARPVAIRVLDSIVQPFAARVLRPVIWLPSALLIRLAPAQLEALIAHELAHVRRLDWLWNGLQCAIESLLFFHPAVWLLGRRVRQEREHACDDLAAAVCGDTVVVAEALAALASFAVQRPPLPRLVLAAGGGVLVQRVARLVGAQPARGLRWSTVALVLAALLAGGLLAARSSVAAPQVAASAAPSPAVPVSSVPDSDPWWTTVGDSVRLRFDDDGHVREYHAWRDLRGEHHETFRVDGVPQAVDANVRRWVAEHRAAPPVPPMPAVPSMPSVPPMPAVPDMAAVPDLPPPPELATLPAYRALLDQLAADPAAIARLGSPIEVVDDCGPCRIDDQHVALTLTARGPKGVARLRASGRRVDGAWHYDQLRLDSIGSLRDLLGYAG